MTVKPCNRLAVGAKYLDRQNLSTFFKNLFQHMICLIGFLQLVQKQKMG